MANNYKQIRDFTETLLDEYYQARKEFTESKYMFLSEERKELFKKYKQAENQITDWLYKDELHEELSECAEEYFED